METTQTVDNVQNTLPVKRIVAVMFVGIAAVSLSSILIRIADAPALVIAFYRLLFASTFFWITSFDRIEPELKKISSQYLVLALLSGAALALHFGTWITSLFYTSVASSVVLVSMLPLFVSVGAVFVLKEPVRPMLYWGLIIAFVGATVIALNDAQSGENSLLGDMLALAGAIFGGVYFLIGRKMRQQFSTSAYVTVCYTTAAVLLLIGTLFIDAPLFDYSLPTFGLFLLIALIPQVIGHTSFNWTLKYLSAPTVSVLLLGEPIGASILAYIFLDESLGWHLAIGGGITLVGVAITIYSEQPQS